jgi:uncharacterized membrane protein YjjP (DUF1212 family)
VIDAVLWAGQLLLEHGAEAERVERTIRACGERLGAQSIEVSVSYGALIVTYESAGDFRTKLRRASPKGVNMQLIESISHLSHQVEAGGLGLPEFRASLERIRSEPRHYGTLLTAAIGGIGCGAFCRIFDGNWPAFALTCVAACAGSWLRGFVLRRQLNTFVSAVFAAALSYSIVLVAHALLGAATPSAALSACVLTLIPGVALINSAVDAVKGHLALALARAAEAALVILSATLGALVASRVIGALLP